LPAARGEKRGECHQCHKRGHFIKDCPEVAGRRETPGVSSSSEKVQGLSEFVGVNPGDEEGNPYLDASAANSVSSAGGARGDEPLSDGLLRRFTLNNPGPIDVAGGIGVSVNTDAAMNFLATFRRRMEFYLMTEKGTDGVTIISYRDLDDGRDRTGRRISLFEQIKEAKTRGRISKETFDRLMDLNEAGNTGSHTKKFLQWRNTMSHSIVSKAVRACKELGISVPDDSALRAHQRAPQLQRARPWDDPLRWVTYSCPIYPTRYGVVVAENGVVSLAPASTDSGALRSWSCTFCDHRNVRSCSLEDSTCDMCLLVRGDEVSDEEFTWACSKCSFSHSPMDATRCGRETCGHPRPWKCTRCEFDETPNDHLSCDFCSAVRA
jgi:hypothetical protein